MQLQHGRPRNCGLLGFYHHTRCCAQAAGATEGFGVLTCSSVAPIISVLIISLIKRPMSKVRAQAAPAGVGVLASACTPHVSQHSLAANRATCSRCLKHLALSLISAQLSALLHRAMHVRAHRRLPRRPTPRVAPSPSSSLPCAACRAALPLAGAGRVWR